jgi:hypothetical protein
MRPTFPTHKNLTNLSRDDAKAALAALRALCERDLVSIYTSAGSNDTHWQVWDNQAWRRIPLAEWASKWLTSQKSEAPHDA